MAEPKISTFIVGLLLVGFIAGVLGLALVEFSGNYDVDYGDNESFAAFNKLENLTSQTEGVKAGLEEGKTKKGVLDILGDFFSKGYNSLKIAWGSFGVYDALVDQGVQRAGLGEAGSMFKAFLIASVIIVLVLGVVVSALVRRNV